MNDQENPAFDEREGTVDPVIAERTETNDAEFEAAMQMQELACQPEEDTRTSGQVIGVDFAATKDMTAGAVFDGEQMLAAFPVDQTVEVQRRNVEGQRTEELDPLVVALDLLRKTAIAAFQEHLKPDTAPLILRLCAHYLTKGKTYSCKEKMFVEDFNIHTGFKYRQVEKNSALTPFYMPWSVSEVEVGQLVEWIEAYHKSRDMQFMETLMHAPMMAAAGGVTHAMQLMNQLKTVPQCVLVSNSHAQHVRIIQAGGTETCENLPVIRSEYGRGAWLIPEPEAFGVLVTDHNKDMIQFRNELGKDAVQQRAMDFCFSSRAAFSVKRVVRVA